MFFREDSTAPLPTLPLILFFQEITSLFFTFSEIPQRSLSGAKFNQIFYGFGQICVFDSGVQLRSP